ncbi:MAG: hypothetical protein LBN71_08970, partial [Tannerella sp.]|nr:hypothetical protein [Tannerella sp.]
MNKVIVTLFFTLFVASLPAQTNIWVSPVGSGSDFSKTKPGSLTGTELNAKIISLRSGGVRHIAVNLLPGVYSNVPVYLRQDIAGNINDTLSFIGSYENTATLSGGKKVSGWQAVGNGIYRAQLPAGTDDFRQLYVNGEPAVRARTPNLNNKEDYGPYWRLKSIDKNTQKILLKPEEYD